jgi:hypothetical protein
LLTFLNSAPTQTTPKTKRLEEKCPPKQRASFCLSKHPDILIKQSAMLPKAARFLCLIKSTPELNEKIEQTGKIKKK